MRRLVDPYTWNSFGPSRNGATPMGLPRLHVLSVREATVRQRIAHQKEHASQQPSAGHWRTTPSVAQPLIPRCAPPSPRKRRGEGVPSAVVATYFAKNSITIFTVASGFSSITQQGGSKGRYSPYPPPSGAVGTKAVQTNQPCSSAPRPTN